MTRQRRKDQGQAASSVAAGDFCSLSKTTHHMEIGAASVFQTLVSRVRGG
jgi:hypothetical protein